MSQSHKLPPFEGLRGIAAFIVVIWHLRQTFYATSSEDIILHLSSFPYVLARPLMAVLEGLCNGTLATFAVWLFWIMSGFVLSLQFFLRVHQTPSDRAHDYLEDAFLRRYPRLAIPVLASVAFAYVLHLLHLMYNESLAHTLGEPYASGWLASWYKFPASALGAIKSSLWESFFSFNASSTYNSVLWTMEKEFYGSLFLFAFLGLLGHRSSRFFAYPVIALINFKFQINWLNAFVAGIALCDLFVNQASLSPLQYLRHRSALRFVRSSALFAVLTWILIIVGVGLSNYYDVSYPALGVAAVTLTLVSTVTQRFLTSRVPLFLGRISFGLYLIHIPVICSFSCWAYLVTFSSLGHFAAAFLSSAMTCVLSIILGYLLYIVADRPGIRLSRSLSLLIMNASKLVLQRN